LALPVIIIHCNQVKVAGNTKQRCEVQVEETCNFGLISHVVSRTLHASQVIVEDEARQS